MAGREDSADRLHGVAGEGDLPAGFLLDLRRVAMARGRVDAHDPGPLRVLGGGTSIESSGRGSRLRIDDDSSRVDDARLQKRPDREDRRGRDASRA